MSLLAPDAASKAAALFAEAVATASDEARQYPSHATVLPDMLSADYSAMLCTHGDRRACAFAPSGEESAEAPPRALCPHAAVARCRFDAFDSQYSGMFAGASNCIIRMSTAAQPAPRPTGMLARFGMTMGRAMAGKVVDSNLFPFVALKACRDGAECPSANLLFAGCKTGQQSRDFLANAVASMMTEKVGVALMPIVANMRKHSAHPLALGVSDWARIEESGAPCDAPRFPWAVILMPTEAARTAMAEGLAPSGGGDGRGSSAAAAPTPRFDAYIDVLTSAFVAGTALYDVFACPSPANCVGGGLERIGRLVTTSAFVHSGLQSSLFFKHQAKEEDYALRPEWLEQLSLPCGDGGGTVATHAGWKVFQRHIEAKNFVDCERE